MAGSGHYRSHNRKKYTVNKNALIFNRRIVLLTGLDLLLYWSFEANNAVMSNDSTTPSLLTVFASARLWACTAVILSCTLLMIKLVGAQSFLQRPMKFWILKNSIASNLVGFYIWYPSPTLSTVRANLGKLGYKSILVLLHIAKAVDHALYEARYLLLVCFALLALRVILQSHANAVNKTIKEHERKVERAIERHGFVTEQALNYQTKTIEAAAINISTSIYACQDQIAVATKQITYGIDRQGARLTQQRIEGVPQASRDERLVKYELENAKLGILNSKASITQAVIGAVGTIGAIAGTAGCTVM